MWTLLLLFKLGSCGPEMCPPTLVFGIETEAECQALAEAALLAPLAKVEEAICHHDQIEKPKGEPT